MSLSDDLSWWEQFRLSDAYRKLEVRPIAYFCAEFALLSNLKTYSGGLGILAGDIVREAAAQKLPLVGVGLLYDKALQKSQLSSAKSAEIGLQKKSDRPDSDSADLSAIRSGPPQAGQADLSRFEPTSSEINGRPEDFGLELVAFRGQPLTVKVPIQDRYLTVAAYRWPSTRVGAGWWSGGVRTAPVYLLTTDCPGNDPRDCCITDKLYPADKEKRLQQEMILGIGGLRLLEALGIHPAIYHLNEGHSAFLALEIIRHEMSERLIGFDNALELARRHIVFTNHTLIPAGNDIFSNDLVAANLQKYAEELAIPVDRLVRLGLVQESSLFSMTMLSLRLAGKANAVSQLHAQKAAEIWKDHPMKGITNGIHVGTWDRLSYQSSVFGSQSQVNQFPVSRSQTDKPITDKPLTENRQPRTDNSNSDLWNLHRHRKRLLLDKIKQTTGHDWPEDCLLLGWARRFVGYKRPLALFFDPAWLTAICTRPGRPVRLVISGAVQEGDEEGEKLLAKLQGKQGLGLEAGSREVNLSSIQAQAQSPVQHPGPSPISTIAAYLPNYDMDLAQLLTAGCDVWLNTPIVGFEACGTSGMKACLNGVLPISTKDGWMAEIDRKSQLTSAGISHHRITENSDKSDPIYPVYPQSDLSRSSRFEPTSSGSIGWLIDSDKVSDSLYQTLENQVIPLYFDHPQEWLKNMVSARQLILENFTTTRVLKEYIEKLYLSTLTI